MIKKSEPERTCIGCREKKPQKELIRIVRNQNGEVSIDETGRSNGRGAYICKSEECFLQAVKTKAFSRALNTEATEALGKELIETIRR